MIRDRSPAADSDRTSIRIATWNVERPTSSQPGRLAALHEWLGRVNADVWVLTETSTRLVPGADYVAVESCGADRPGEAEERWVTIWSRLPVIDEPTTVDCVRTACARLRTPDGGALVVYGSVLPWVSSGWGGHRAKGGVAFCAALEAQSGDWQRIRKDDPTAMLCVAGDLNQDLRARHHYGSRVRKRALADAIAGVDMVCLTAEGRDPVDRQTRGTWASIDHICVSRELAGRATEAQAWPQADAPVRTISDHFGAWVNVTMPARA